MGVVALVPFHACAERVLEDLSQDILQMYRYVPRAIRDCSGNELRQVGDSNRYREGTHANVAFASPSMTI